ncbi:FliH/SctL family protein [Bacillus sp. S3]|uniref:FliH/SctL family protein n=1 Tax=Bacillus sp. S3 TaxID=486398 RepID=UPI001680452B|nr:FliH/SctL family protein [Bacillus sp. S3]
MTSYSKVFKASNLSLIDEVKVITLPRDFGEDRKEESSALQGKEEIKIEEYPMVKEANEKAQLIMEEARQKAQAIETAADERINQWWEENQKRLEAMAVETKEQAIQQGYDEGKNEAITAIQEEYQGKLAQAQDLLEQAYAQKETIISEAEPFLLELSTVIASQIIKQELEDCPDKFVELIQQHILRFKEKEHITICVHPDDFPFIQSQRVQLIAMVNGETEIKIIPDHSVTSKGCIIRTAYGSVDARIDTQMEEIKKVILEAKRGHQSDTIS